eukprot:TRINITY_DN42308_c0_g1_i2.p1 TRINITY_DN42308_c0_g1~~TRINITY_DN42308_c0_g1_i2.p1  ORF type:complete len:404 (-),score=33.41 TRINITY_DN42308_c0_g1_i2:254-1411(-)
MYCSISSTSRGTITQKSLFVNTHKCQRRNRSNLVVRNTGIFNIFGDRKTSSAAAELVNEIIDLSRPTYTGINAGQKRKQQIAELVDELSRFAGRAPTRDPNIWGNFQLLYSETPTKIAGPFRSPIGLTVFANQGLYQILDKATKSVEIFIEFKTLGLVPGFIKKRGSVSFPSSTTYRFDFSDQELNFGVSSNKKAVTNNFITFEVVYQDERIRIVTLEGKDSFSIYERVDFEEYEEETRQQEEVIEEEKEEGRGFFPFRIPQNGAKQDGGTLTIQTPKESVQGTVRLGERSMDVVKDNLKTYQDQLKSAKQQKKEMSSQLKDFKKQLDEQTKQVNKIQNQLVKTEVGINEINSQLDQFDKEDQQDYAQLETLQNKLKQLELQAKS